MMTESKVHATEVSYELHTLGWKAFQDLCATILTKVLGQTIEQFLATRDGGRDGAFYGSSSNLLEGSEKGSYTVQCKHTSTSGKNISLESLSDELIKAKRLAAKGLATNYLLMTNYSVTGKSEEEIRKAFLNVKGIKWFGLYGSTWINSRIRENSKLRMLVPRIYGIGDLSQILDERSYEQARAILDSMGPDLRKFVMTDAHNKAANAIIEHGFVILLGEPGSGKSMIAATLALGAIDVWNCATMKLVGPDEFISHWNPHEPRQFFWVDDAFGTTQYQQETTFAWNRVFPHLQSAINSGARILFTSRDYIFKAAINNLKLSAFPLLKQSQVIINVQELSLAEKQQMVYNHIKLGDQPQEFKKKIKPFLEEVAESERFLPEIARRLGSRLFTKRLNFNSQSINDFVENPLEYLTEIISQLDSDAKAAVGLLFMNGGSIASPITLSDANSKALKLLGSSSARLIDILPSLDGNILKFIHSNPSRWIYKHPTVGDAYAKLIANNPELIDIYLGGVTPVKLMQEVTCGDVGIQGAIIIPEIRYPAILAKIQVDTKDVFNLLFFLSYRCDTSFLNYYLKENPNILQFALKIYSHVGVSSQAIFLARLHEFKLLSEHDRAFFVKRISELAVETPDADFITDKRIKAVLKDAEYSSILEKVKTELIPCLDSVIDEWHSNYDSSEDPDSYFEILKDALTTYQEVFSEDEDIYDEIDNALTDIDNIVSELSPSTEDDRWEDDEINRPSSPSLERSIFDDVDE